LRQETRKYAINEKGEQKQWVCF